MTRVIEAEKEYKTGNTKKAIDMFFKAFPNLDYWREEIESMMDRGVDYTCDNTLADGSRNNDWCYALHLDCGENYTYICIIERA